MAPTQTASRWGNGTVLQAGCAGAGHGVWSGAPGGRSHRPLVHLRVQDPETQPRARTRGLASASGRV